MYHRLFKDSKIKYVKDTEFTEYLKLKRSQDISKVINQARNEMDDAKNKLKNLRKKLKVIGIQSK